MEYKNSNEQLDTALDVVRTASKTSAVGIFALNISRIRALLDASSKGITQSQRKIRGLQKQIDKASTTEIDENEDLTVPKIISTRKGKYEITISEDDFMILKNAVEEHASIVNNIHYHLHNILLASTWSAFEGYIQSIFAWIFSNHPDMLSSEKQISIKEVVESRSNIIEHLIAKEIDDIGRKSFSDLQSYMKSKVKVQISGENFDRLREMYFLRNVIAHSAGFLRNEQLSQVPDNIEVINNEIKINSHYLVSAIDIIEMEVRNLNSRLTIKYKK